MAWVEPEIWYQNLPRFYAAAGVLITDPDDRLLLVKPNYRDHWSFPGGILEASEAPHHAAARELAEELGLKTEIGKLLVVDWAAPMGQRPSAIMYFLFDGGTTSSDDAPSIDPDEIEDMGYFHLDQATAQLSAHSARRAQAGMSARRTGETIYLPIA
jgi:ADP-ribose pyrophosphatase YjhB (NUDIX family)